MLNTYDIGANKWWQNWHFWQTIPLMVSNHVTVHIHIYAHQVTTMHTQTCTHLSCWYWLTDCMTPRVSLPTPKNENGVEWLMALCSLYWLSMQTESHTHTRPTPPSAESTADRRGLEAFLPCWCCCHILHWWLSVGCTHTHAAHTHTRCTHTHTQTMRCLSLDTLSLSQCHCHAHMDCVFVCVCESMCYISYILYVCTVYVKEDCSTCGELSVSIHNLLKGSCSTGTCSH